MKKQSTIKKRIETEHRMRCYQIGIPAIEEPKICWNREQFRWYVGYKKNSKRNLGRANYRNNAILIDLKNHKDFRARRKRKASPLRTIFLNPSERELEYNFIEIRDTLIHELVHMRWQGQRHGYKFRELIARIKKGEIFPMRTADDVAPFFNKGGSPP